MLQSSGRRSTPANSHFTLRAVLFLNFHQGHCLPPKSLEVHSTPPYMLLPGDWLEMEMDTRLVGHNANNASQPVVVAVSCLHSYEARGVGCWLVALPRCHWVHSKADLLLAPMLECCNELEWA